MRFAYVDTSAIVAIALGEPGSRALAARLARFDQLLASNLLEAELRSALAREAVTTSPADLLSAFTWVFPNRPLSPEIETVLRHGYLKGADLWHLATALYLDSSAKTLAFVTLDARQATVAEAAGFKVPEGPRRSSGSSSSAR